MEVLYFLVPVSLLLAFVALGGFVWAVKSGQYDDLDLPAKDMVFDGSPGRAGAQDQDKGGSA